AAGQMLIVEDEMHLANAVVDALTDEGYIVVHASDGEEALVELRNRTFDAIVCDLKMPRMDGPSFYRNLAAVKPYLAKHVIFVTGDVAGTAAEGFLKESGCRWLPARF